MSISKAPEKVGNCRRPIALFDSARDAMGAYLDALGPWDSRVILLPAYVGWSPLEGSGVLDPVKRRGLQFAFYEIDSELHIDVSSVRKCLEQYSVLLLVIIHYFGFVDPAYEQVVGLARSAGVCILEDEAHAMLTDLTTAKCGRLGDAAIYSIHKLLPTHRGGALVLNTEWGAAALRKGLVARETPDPWSYDLVEIARKRRQNYARLHAELATMTDDIEALRDLSFEVPQSLPVLVRAVDRDRLYVLMNEAGFGCVSLYHTLVNEIGHDEFPRSHFVSERVFNLPVHQDVTFADIEQLVSCLTLNINRLKRST